MNSDNNARTCSHHAAHYVDECIQRDKNRDVIKATTNIREKKPPCSLTLFNHMKQSKPCDIISCHTSVDETTWAEKPNDVELCCSAIQQEVVQWKRMLPLGHQYTKTP